MWQWSKNQYHLITALLANIYYGFPSRKLTVIGITGTSGKSTTTHMIYDILKAAGYKASLLSTVERLWGKSTIRDFM
jgi:UDP-N-acetylmuramoyl-L-alanyl-D-glutamate--2,6-diaminopimelate ligase